MNKIESFFLDLEKLSTRVSPAELAKAKAFDRHWSKRAFDLLVAVPLTIILLPFFGFFALLISIDSPGPAFYTQDRVGRYGKIIKIIKFRSMRIDIDDRMHQEHIKAYANGHLNLENGNKIVDDPRVTRVGRFLRRTSIDEFPQLFNVLKGEMSLVGPRPVPVYEVDEYKLWQSERLNSLPGMTGLWQVTRRGLSTFDEQLRLDIRYIHNQSMWLNIKLLLLTIPAVISKAGAK